MLRQPPLPLATLSLQKEAITHLRMPGERMMKLAEELYQEGFISYPRTETDCFDPAYDLKVPLPPHSSHGSSCSSTYGTSQIKRRKNPSLSQMCGHLVALEVLEALKYTFRQHFHMSPLRALCNLEASAVRTVGIQSAFD